jgi:hypothetical protein
MTTIHENIRAVQARIETPPAMPAAAAPASVSLLAVSKTFGADAVQLAHAAGQSLLLARITFRKRWRRYRRTAPAVAAVALYRADSEQQDPPGGRAL